VAADVARSFRVKDLRRRSSCEGAEGVTARRLLEAVFTQCAFYLPPQLFSRREYALAAAVLGVAADIHPDRWDVWYNLAAAQARNGQRRQALDALERAIASGFSDAQHLAADDDFASVRGEKRFREIAARLR
jgi:tetratricopeptide (TPR) repeat protein